ncbi:MAG: hypothetical protein ACRYFU_23570 [Janthinobacterium lividum]
MPKTPLLVYGLIIGLSFACHCHGQNGTPAKDTPKASNTGPTIPPLKNVNPEVLRLVVEDQWDRGNDMFGKGQINSPKELDWKIIGAHDNARHQAIRDLLAAGKLKTSSDYDYASLIFQHSGDPSELMLAHLLSSTSVSMGGNGKWMMAATLDRYLQSTKQPQIFGPQFITNDGHTWTMEPYNRTTVTDSERALWCVVTLAQQEKILDNMQKGNSGASTGIEGCK